MRLWELSGLAILLCTSFLLLRKFWSWHRELGRIVASLKAAAKNLETLHAENLKLEEECARLVLEISKRLDVQRASSQASDQTRGGWLGL